MYFREVLQYCREVLGSVVKCSTLLGSAIQHNSVQSRAVYRPWIRVWPPLSLGEATSQENVNSNRFLIPTSQKRIKKHGTFFYLFKLVNWHMMVGTWKPKLKPGKNWRRKNNLLSEFQFEVPFWLWNTKNIILQDSSKNINLSEFFTVFRGPNGNFN